MTNLTLFSIAIGTAAMILVLSVFSGFVEISQNQYSIVNPDIKITAKKGKVIPFVDSIEQFVVKSDQAEAIARTIEEKIYLSYKNKQDLAYLKAVDERYNKIYPLDSMVFYGGYLSFRNQELLISDTLANRLGIVLNDLYPIELMSPKPGKGTLSEGDLRRVETYVNGVFFIPDEKYGQYVFTNIQTAENLFNLEKGSAYALEIKLKDALNAPEYKETLTKKFGKTLTIETRADQDAAYLKMLNLENTVVYVILCLVVLVLSFSLIGVLYVLILDKKVSSFTLWSMGMQQSEIKQIYFYTGFILTILACLLGIIFGSAIALLQLKTGVFAPGGLPFPVHFTAFNYFLVFCTVIGMGTLVSYIFSRKILVEKG